MHIVVQDPSLFVRSNREGLGLFLRADIESLVVDALEAALDHCIFLLLCLKDALVQIDVFYNHPFSIDHDIARNSFAALCNKCFSSTRQYIFGLSPTNSVMRCPLCSSYKMRLGNFLLKLRNDSNEGNLLLSTS